MVLVIVLILSSFALFFGLVMIFFENPLYSIFSFLLCVFFTVLLLIAYGVEFMSFIYLVVYIGAIGILFLFIIMMLNVNSINILPTYSLTTSFFIYACIFLKTFSVISLVNKNMFLHYLYPVQNHTPALFLSNEHVLMYSWCGIMCQTINNWLDVLYRDITSDCIYIIEGSTCMSLKFSRFFKGEDYEFVCSHPSSVWVCGKPDPVTAFRELGVYLERYLTYSPRVEYFRTEFAEVEPIFIHFFTITNSSIDTLADNVISSFDSRVELANFCLLYDIYVINFFLAGFILLCAMLGSISLCLQK